MEKDIKKTRIEKGFRGGKWNITNNNKESIVDNNNKKITSWKEC